MDRAIAEQIVQDLNIANEDFEQRKRFLEIGKDDLERIRDLRKYMGAIPTGIFDRFYNHLMAFSETKDYFQDREMIERLKHKHLLYFEKLLSGKYDREYLLSRLSVGYTHVQLNIVPLWYIGAYSIYIDEIRKIAKESAKDAEETMQSLLKVILLEIVLTLESYHYVKYKLQEELKKLAVTDDLTGIFNRRKLEEVMQYEMDRSTRQNKPLSLLMIDIDHFKKVNDLHGHDVGDYVLTSIAKLMNDGLRKTDYLIRYGGEEFIIYLPDTSLKIAATVAERLRKNVESHTFYPVGRITISIGVVRYDRADTKDTFLKRADEKLY
jgi:diguanylate cyclase (GGDEF)-like protein